MAKMVDVFPADCISCWLWGGKFQCREGPRNRELRVASKAVRNWGPQSKSPQQTVLYNHHGSTEVDLSRLSLQIRSLSWLTTDCSLVRDPDAQDPPKPYNIWYSKYLLFYFWQFVMQQQIIHTISFILIDSLALEKKKKEKTLFFSRLHRKPSSCKCLTKNEIPSKSRLVNHFSILQAKAKRITQDSV